MITSLGTFLRRLRLAKGEILKDMAESLGVSSAFLSAVENGKKKMPGVNADFAGPIEEIKNLHR